MAKAVVTGIGCVTPIGIGIDAFTQGLREGVSGIVPVSRFDAEPYQCRVAAEVRNFDAHQFLELREIRALPRVVQFAVAAAKLALDQSGLRVSTVAARTGILLGTSSGPVSYMLEQHAVFLERGIRRMHPSAPAFGHNSAIASECAIQLGIHGPVLTLSSACTSGADSIGLGAVMIDAGLADVVFVGGAEAPLTPSLFGAFDRLGMMPHGYNDRPEMAARPFDVQRQGPVLGEGAAILILERPESAVKRGAAILAEVAGYGATCDAGSHFQQNIDGNEATRAVDIALASAGIAPERLGYVNAHGTGTRENDAFEARVLHRVLGSYVKEVPVSSSKSQFGHLLGASGAIEAAAIVAGMTGGFIPATLNLEDPDPQCDLQHVTGSARAVRIDTALSTSFGFGSRNAALVLRRYEA